MKRKQTYLGITLATLVLVSTALAQPAAGPRPDRPPVDPARQRRTTDGQRQALQIRRQIAALKTSHETLIADLRAIHAAALLIDCIAFGTLFLETIPANLLFLALILLGCIFLITLERKTEVVLKNTSNQPNTHKIEM